MGKKYIVQKGDTLGNIAKQFTGSSSKYMELANANNINNPDLIYPGQEIEIPDKFDKPLKFEEIPSKNKKQIIDNYSPHYNYIVEGDKIYYSRKGHNDYWVDISDNDVARKNLYTFLNNKYDFKGYEDNEQKIYQEIENNTYNYSNRNKHKQDIAEKPKKVRTVNDLLAIKPQTNNYVETAFQLPYHKPINNNSKQTKRKNLDEVNEWFNEKYENIKTSVNTIIDNTKQKINSFGENIENLYETGRNGIERKIEKRFSNDDKTSNLKVKAYTSPENSKYNIIPETYTGTDTIKYDNGQYIIPESIDLNNIKLKTRNRGDYKEIDTEGGIITAFNPFTEAKQYKNNKNYENATFMGTDKNGNFKIGKISDFEDTDNVSRTFENEIYGFAKDEKGNQKYKNDAKHGNASRSVPVVYVKSSNGKIEGSLNILTDKNQKGDTYGNITGGRLICKVGNETRLLSGSINSIEQQIEDMKTRHKSETAFVYTLDNGSYNRGLRTLDKHLSSNDLKSYDRQNTGGGNFMYIDNNGGYPSDTVLTKNIRTINDESYKKGHSLVNERKGITLHHTGFMQNDLKNVTNLLTKPEGNSAHVIIGFDGQRRILATPDKVTFHAGQSYHNGRFNVNDFMVGIEFQGDTNKKALTEDQINSAIDYMVPIIRENNISLEDIVTHEQIRKNYNKYKSRFEKEAPGKPDITYDNYVRILNALKNRLYYNK